MPIGTVMRSTGMWYDILCEDQSIKTARLKGKLKLNDLKLTNPIAVGDRVNYQTESNEDPLLILSIAPRTNYVIRKSVHKEKHSHIIASNIDLAIIIATLAFPRTSMGFIDRFLTSCESFRIPAMIVFNKSDLYDDEINQLYEEVKLIYEKIGYPTLLTSCENQESIKPLISKISGKTVLFSGHSGVGKSSMINILHPDAEQRTGEISDFSNKGLHTTTFAEMFIIDQNTFLIDTPGIKEFGIVNAEKDDISHYFPEFRTLMNQCKYNNCKHINEPGCAVKSAVESNNIAKSRYESYLSIIDNKDNRR